MASATSGASRRVDYFFLLDFFFADFFDALAPAFFLPVLFLPLSPKILSQFSQNSGVAPVRTIGPLIVMSLCCASMASLAVTSVVTTAAFRPTIDVNDSLQRLGKLSRGQAGTWSSHASQFILAPVGRGESPGREKRKDRDMWLEEFDDESRYRDIWEAVQIARPVHYSLFTFGESELPYFLVCDKPADEDTVTVTQGEVRITRPTIITPENARPEFRGFFGEQEDDSIVEFLMARTAGFSNLRVDNTSGPAEIISDRVEEAVEKLNRRLDEQEEDRTAILTAPYGLGGVALLRYAAERIWQSAPDNVQELRERGFLP